MTKTEFFQKYGGSLVKADEDNAEYGDFLFLHPEEIDRVKKYDDKNHMIVSVHDTEDEEDFVDMEQPIDYGTQPYKYGYLVVRVNNL